MKISYNWLKNYIELTETPDQLSEILTSIGLEVENVEEVELIQGGLKGLVVGQVLECAKHPDSDHLSLTKVDIGTTILPIVCGAPNVATGQKVIVATVGTKLYSAGKEFEIKKAKIRGKESMGMICAEDEIGLGKSHDGIIVLPESATTGTPAAEYYNVKSDHVFTIGLTPNRSDAASHIGVARDLAAYYSFRDKRTYKTPDISDFKIDSTTNTITVHIDDTDGCLRYAGLTIEGVKTEESPKWLKERLTAIGLNPINNIVDATNFVLHELGQPIHAFDLDLIKGNKVIVKTLPQDTPFVTLDKTERKLDANDLMICDIQEGMCMAGIFGGLKSGINNNTTKIFLESAWFNPIRIRKTARLHGLSTDSSFRFERGTDPNMVVTALKRTANIIKEIAGGEITSNIIDLVPKKVQNTIIDFNIDAFYTMVGTTIPTQTVKTILQALEIEIKEIAQNNWLLSVPPYRVDVRRQADIAEEILRIYGFNNIETSNKMVSSITQSPKPNPEILQDKISDMLVASGYYEMMNNSITKSLYFANLETFDHAKIVQIINPLSSDLNCMRPTMLFSGLETLQFNCNRQNSNLRFFEFGKIYQTNSTDIKTLKSITEQYKLAIITTGNKNDQNWNSSDQRTTFFDLKAIVDNIINRMGIANLNTVELKPINNDVCREGLTIIYRKKELGYIWVINKKLSKQFDIPTEIYYAELDWQYLITLYSQNRTEYSEVPKYPAVRRDLALLIDKKITFDSLKAIALRTEKNILKQVGLFDVYEGDKIAENQKSYALSFILQDPTKTLNDKQIDKTMQRLIAAFEKEVGAKLR